jgi:hypothetical protein
MGKVIPTRSDQSVQKADQQREAPKLLIPGIGIEVERPPTAAQNVRCVVSQRSDLPFVVAGIGQPIRDALTDQVYKRSGVDALETTLATLDRPTNFVFRSGDSELVFVTK